MALCVAVFTIRCFAISRIGCVRCTIRQLRYRTEHCTWSVCFLRQSAVAAWGYGFTSTVVHHVSSRGFISCGILDNFLQRLLSLEGVTRATSFHFVVSLFAVRIRCVSACVVLSFRAQVLVPALTHRPSFFWNAAPVDGLRISFTDTVRCNQDSLHCDAASLCAILQVHLIVLRMP